MKRSWLLIVLALTVCAAGCEVMRPAGTVVTDSRSVEQGDAKSVSVELDLHVGGLKLSGGASDLMNAEFRYNVPEWKPEVQYSVAGTEGTLVVRQPTTKNLRLTNTKNHWDVRLRDLVPMSLNVRCRTGDSDLYLAALNLSSLVVDNDTGSASVDLTGGYPSLASVRVESDTGSCRVKMGGDYPSLTSLTATTHTGGVTADLSGHWGRSADIEIASNTGGIEVTVPADVGVRVLTRVNTGGVHAAGLNQHGNVYTNAAYGQSPVTLNLNVHTETGGITLRTAR